MTTPEDWWRQHAVLIGEYETLIRAALVDDPDFDPTSPAIVRGVQPRESGGFRIVPGPAIPTGCAVPSMPRAWTPDRQLLAELAARTMECRSTRWLASEQRVLPMPETWPEVLQRRWPGQFDCQLSIYGGWVDLLIATHTWLIELGSEFRWSQIKEKLGGARFYSEGNVGTAGHELISIAEHLSDHICEKCGAPGTRRSEHGWLSTRCDEHIGRWT